MSTVTEIQVLPIPNNKALTFYFSGCYDSKPKPTKLCNFSHFVSKIRLFGQF
jgi:hypothetical protein